MMQLPQREIFCKKMNKRLSFKKLFGCYCKILNWVISQCDIITFRLGSSVLGSTFVFTRHFGAKTISSRSHFEDDSSPHISGSGFSIWIVILLLLDQDPVYSDQPLYLPATLVPKLSRVDLTLKMTPLPIFLDPVLRSGLTLRLHYLSMSF